MLEDSEGREGLRRHRRSLLAISSVVIVYQLGWVSISDSVPAVGGLKVATEYLPWILGAIFLYFFVLYHQTSWPLRIRSVLLLRASEWIGHNVFRAAQKKASLQARSKERDVVFRTPTTPPAWAIAPKQWNCIFELRTEANASDGREISVEIKNTFYVYSIRAWVHCLLTDSTIIEEAFPSVWAGVAILLAIPRIGALVHALLGS